MNRGCLAPISMLVLTTTMTSCGPGEGPALYPVSGKVIYKGQPAVGATVMFQREDAPPNSSPIVPVGQADDEGNFTLECDPGGQGAPAGKYKVLIQWRSKEAGKIEPPAQAATTQAKSKTTSRYKVVPDKPDGAPDLLEGRYMKADGSRFHVEVKPEKNTFEPFDVSS
jgi:hypothetical protein